MPKTLVLIVLLVSNLVWAEEPLPPADMLQKQLDSLTSFSADFEQTTYEQDGFLLDEQSGQLLFARPSQLRWEAVAPFAQTLVADGVDIYFYDPDLNQVTIRPWSDDPGQNPAAIFLSDRALVEHFSIAMEDGVFVLTPNSERTSVEKLRLSFDGAVPEFMEILDSLGQITSIRFSEQNIEPEIDPQAFQFLVPENAEVITDG